MVRGPLKPPVPFWIRVLDFANELLNETPHKIIIWTFDMGICDTHFRQSAPVSHPRRLDYFPKSLGATSQAQSVQEKGRISPVRAPNFGWVACEFEFDKIRQLSVVLMDRTMEPGAYPDCF